ncbi:MAG: HIT domain-containing protein, partial [Chlorobiaceae bacterium]|nr:HIT domain-containing protein [Chlorobiaceae bacterium]
MQRMYSPWREIYMQSFKDEKPEPTEGKSVFADIPPEEDEARYVLCRGTHCFAILNLYPYNCGHLMVIPYMQTPEFSDLDDPTRLEIMQMADLCMQALKTTLKPQGFNLGANLGKVAGGSV